ncbi:hypothetical protein [Maribacter aquivivus]|uniref:hypothetical protein n=1 Tax=Maribacter aquivivus TaxID=228958 RepID=UPI002492F9D4|nr:hypothetical protein [Maribacter aquivivus]
MSCKGQTESDKRFSAEGEFAYNVQLAHFETGQVESRGECTKEIFIKEFEKFKWKEQLTQANINLSVSPTISVINNESKNEMGISVVGNNENDYGFWIFYGKDGFMNSIEVYDEKSVIPYVEKFFLLDFKTLDNEFKN